MEVPLSWLLVAVTILLGLLLLHSLIRRRYDYFEERGVPFSEPTLLFGSMAPVLFRRRSFGETLIDLYMKHKGHGLVGLFEFLTPLTMIRDPEIIRMIAVKDFDYFTDHRTTIREDVDPLFGKNMFCMQGERWREIRTVLTPAFTSSKMRAMFPLVTRSGLQLGSHLEKRCRASKDGILVLEMKDLFSRYANDVIATAAFGFHCDSYEEPNNEFYRVGKTVTNFSGIQSLKLLGFQVSTKLMKLLNIAFIPKHLGHFFHSLVHDTIEIREREKIARPDMIHLLMQARQGSLKDDLTDDATEGVSEEQGNKKRVELSDDDVTANALLFFLSGFDASSTLMSFTSHLLAVHPDVQRRVQREIDQVLRETGGRITYEGVQKMTYLDAIFSESLRLYPPTLFSDRQCVKPYVIAASSTNPEVHLDVGDGVAIPIIALHRDPEFFPEPEKFDPERFNEENRKNIRPFTFIPFGVGPRNCIGTRFALMEAKIAFTCLLSRFDLEVVSKTTIPVVMLKATIFTMGAEGGLWLGIRQRSCVSS